MRWPLNSPPRRSISPKRARSRAVGDQARALQRRADRIDHHLGIFLHAQPAPDAFAHQVGEVLAGDARDDPAQHLGMHGAVDEAGAVFAFLLQRLEKARRCLRARVAGRRRQHRLA